MQVTFPSPPPIPPLFPLPLSAFPPPLPSYPASPPLFLLTPFLFSLLSSSPPLPLLPPPLVFPPPPPPSYPASPPLFILIPSSFPFFHSPPPLVPLLPSSPTNPQPQTLLHAKLYVASHTDVDVGLQETLWLIGNSTDNQQENLHRSVCDSCRELPLLAVNRESLLGFAMSNLMVNCVHATTEAHGMLEDDISLIPILSQPNFECLPTLTCLSLKGNL